MESFLPSSYVAIYILSILSFLVLVFAVISAGSIFGQIRRMERVLFSKFSIQIKYTVVFVVAMSLIVVALLVGVQGLKLKQLRNEASTLAEQVVAFRSWVASTGVVWVDNLAAGNTDFLGQREAVDGTLFHSKNPALATRELSKIVGKSSKRATFRVTSDRYRNPSNAPDEFEASALAGFQKDHDLDFLDTIEGDVYRYTQPLYITKGCLRCHGDPKDAPPEVIEKYGSERAFGYKVGDVRGIISVKLPDTTFTDILQAFLSPITVILVIAAFLINYFYTQRSIINRLKTLSHSTEEIAKGDLDLQLPAADIDSNDEIDHVNHAVHLLRKSVSLMLKRANK